MIVLNDFQIKSKSQEDWLKWINNELLPPVKMSGLIVDVLVLFRELLNSYDIYDEQINKIYELCSKKTNLLSPTNRVKGKIYKNVEKYIAEAFVETFDKIKKFREEN